MLIPFLANFQSFKNIFLEVKLKKKNVILASHLLHKCCPIPWGQCCWSILHVGVGQEGLDLNTSQVCQSHPLPQPEVCCAVKISLQKCLCLWDIQVSFSKSDTDWQVNLSQVNKWGIILSWQTLLYCIIHTLQTMHTCSGNPSKNTTTATLLTRTERFMVTFLLPQPWTPSSYWCSFHDLTVNVTAQKF